VIFIYEFKNILLVNHVSGFVLLPFTSDNLLERPKPHSQFLGIIAN